MYTEAHKKAFKKYAANNAHVRLYMASKSRAKKANLEHALTPSFIKSIIPEYCPLLNTKLTNISGTGKGPKNLYNPSLDRIDSTKGYTEDNVWVISTLANKVKQDLTKDQLITLAHSILKLFN